MCLAPTLCWSVRSACDKQFNLDEEASDCSDEALEQDEAYEAAEEKAKKGIMIKVHKAANLAMSLGPCLVSPSKENSAEQLADIAMS